MKQQEGDSSRAPKIYKQETEREIRQLGYVLRRNLNKLRILRTVGDFNEWKSYLNLIKMCSKNKF